MRSKRDRLLWVVAPTEETQISLKAKIHKEHPDNEMDEFWEENGMLLIACFGLGCFAMCSLLCCVRCYLKRNTSLRR